MCSESPQHSASLKIRSVRGFNRDLSFLFWYSLRGYREGGNFPTEFTYRTNKRQSSLRIKRTFTLHSKTCELRSESAEITCVTCARQLNSLLHAVFQALLQGNSSLTWMCVTPCSSQSPHLTVGPKQVLSPGVKEANPHPELRYLIHFSSAQKGRWGPVPKASTWLAKLFTTHMF